MNTTMATLLSFISNYSCILGIKYGGRSEKVPFGLNFVLVIPNFVGVQNGNSAVGSVLWQ